MSLRSFNQKSQRAIAFAALLAVLASAIWLVLSPPAGRVSLSPPASPLLKGGDAQQSSAILAKSYPANSASRYARIVATADGFTAPDMQPGLNKPGSHWRNPAKTVQPLFPKAFNNPVRVRSGSADVSAIPLNANPESRAELTAEGNLIYPNAFGLGIDVVYRCEPLKTEEYIVIRNHEQSEVASPRAVASTGVLASAEAVASPLFPLPLREGVGGGVFSRRASTQTQDAASPSLVTRHMSPVTFSWDLHPGALKPRLTPGHTIELCDENGVPRLRINAPEGKDASGKPLRIGKELRITLEGNRVTLAADTSGFEFPIVIDPTWSSTGAMAGNRFSHTSNRLADGRVLVIAGSNFSNLVDTCEIYDPGVNTWSSTGSLNTGREFHTSNVLANGKVLVSGGTDSSNSTSNSSELYDPGTGQWTASGSLNTSRHSHASVVLPNGDVLVSGGATTATCEIYQTALGTWATTGPMSSARSDTTLTLIDNNTVLVAGGNPITATCELYGISGGTWSDTGAMSNARSGHSADLLANGQVLAYSSGTGGNLPAELFNKSTGLWTSTATPIGAHARHCSALLLSNKVLLIGGIDGGAVQQTACEVYDPSSPLWTNTASLATSRSSATATLLSDGTVLVAGGQYSPIDNIPVATCELLDIRPTGFDQNLNAHSGSSLGIALSADSIGTGPVTFNVEGQPAHGTLSGTAPNVSYTSDPTFVGSDSFTFKATDSNGTGPQGTVTIDVTNSAPTILGITSSVTPDNLYYGPPGHPPGFQSAMPGQVISFSVTASDPDGDPLSYSWDFGDGSPLANEQSPTHAYAEAGTYLAAFTVTDPAGAVAAPFKSFIKGVQVFVSKPPVVRFQTSDVVAFATQPFTFDASTSTDPENSIAYYDWDFGDGTPHGAQQIMSKIYDEPGTYTVKLTITDSDGVSASQTRVIEVLGASEAGLFNGFMNYKVSWNRTTENKDTLTFDASVNVGDDVVGAGTPVAFVIAGQRFEGTLDLKLRDFTNVNEKWTVKANLRHQPSGSVSVKLMLKKASLGEGFNVSGITAGGDVHATVSNDVPVHLEVGTHSFEMLVPSDFKFSGGGTRARGSGASE